MSPDDVAIRHRVADICAAGNLDLLTPRVIRKLLEEEFQVDLKHRKAVICAGIDEFMNGRGSDESEVLAKLRKDVARCGLNVRIPKRFDHSAKVAFLRKKLLDAAGTDKPNAQTAARVRKDRARSIELEDVDTDNVMHHPRVRTKRYDF